MDEDITSTLGNAYFAEGQHGYRNNYTWNRTGDGKVNAKKGDKVGGTEYKVDWSTWGIQNNTPKHLDWWNRLERDEHDGMRSVGFTWSDYNVDTDKKLSKKDYEKMANEVVRAKEAKEAADAGKKKLSADDKAAAKEVGSLEKTEDADGNEEKPKKKEEPRKEPKKETKKAKDPNAGGSLSRKVDK